MNFFSKIKNTQDFKSSFENSKVLHLAKPNVPHEELDSYYKNLAKQVGIPIIYEEDPSTGEIRPNHWTKIEYIKGEEENTYKHSNHTQPLHTDYGYFSFEIYCSFFYCEKQAAFGGATTFIDVDKVVKLLQQINPDLLNQLKSTLIHFGRKDNLIAHNDDYILQEDELGWKINWNYYRALEDKENSLLIESFKDFLNINIEKSGELFELKLLPGEAVFFQDRRVLHGRNSFLGERQLNKGAIAKSLPQFVQDVLK